jgi:hypothetical protein
MYSGPGQRVVGSKNWRGVQSTQKKKKNYGYAGEGRGWRLVEEGFIPGIGGGSWERPCKST